MIASDGWRFIVPAGLIAVALLVVLLMTGATWLLIPLLLAALLSLFFAYFFRDPERTPPACDGLILSPADGKVILIDESVDEQGRSLKTISIFMSVFDVHVNRIPVAGKVLQVDYHPGKYYKAFQREAMTENERTEITIQSAQGVIKFTQVAGILARRVVCCLRGDEEVRQGERFGLIRFGSRADLFLGENVEVKVKLGQHVKGGESIIGVFTGNG